jgi:hypothetical protein
MYKQLLNKMDKPSTPMNATADPIVAVYLQPDQFPLINPKTITDPAKIFFREADWKANKKKTHGVLGGDTEGCPFPFLVNSDSTCASSDTITEMQQ